MYAHSPRNISPRRSPRSPREAGVRVGVRVRPFNAVERRNHARLAVTTHDDEIVVVTDFTTGIQRTFSFDDCFWSREEESELFATQERIYDRFGRSLLEGMLSGCNVSLLVVGHPSTGKTYSVIGENEDAGLLPRCGAALYSFLENMGEEGSDYVVQLSVMELYLEQVWDLLGEGENALRIREHPALGPHVPELTYHEISSLRHLRTTLAAVAKKQNKMGHRRKSAEAHTLFSLNLSLRRPAIDGVRWDAVGKITFADLACSDRVDLLSDGTDMKVSSFVNRSLSALSACVQSLTALSHNRKKGVTTHVPYRRSALTWILKDALGGNSLTRVLATVSPADSEVGETVATLRIAEQFKHLTTLPTTNQTNFSVILDSEEWHRQQNASIQPHLPAPVAVPVSLANPNSTVSPIQNLSPRPISKPKSKPPTPPALKPPRSGTTHMTLSSREGGQRDSVGNSNILDLPLHWLLAMQEDVSQATNLLNKLSSLSDEQMLRCESALYDAIASRRDLADAESLVEQSSDIFAQLQEAVGKAREAEEKCKDMQTNCESAWSVLLTLSQHHDVVSNPALSDLFHHYMSLSLHDNPLATKFLQETKTHLEISQHLDDALAHIQQLSLALRQSEIRVEEERDRVKEIETKRKADNALAAAQIIQFQRKIEEQQIQMNKMQHDHNLVRQTLHNTQAEADMLLQRKIRIATAESQAQRESFEGEKLALLRRISRLESSPHVRIKKGAEGIQYEEELDAMQNSLENQSRLRQIAQENASAANDALQAAQQHIVTFAHQLLESKDMCDMYKAQMDKESHRAQYSENLLIQLTEYMQTVTFSTAHSSDKAQQLFGDSIFSDDGDKDKDQIWALATRLADAEKKALDMEHKVSLFQDLETQLEESCKRVSLLEQQLYNEARSVSEEANGHGEQRLGLEDQQHFEMVIGETQHQLRMAVGRTEALERELSKSNAQCAQLQIQLVELQRRNGEFPNVEDVTRRDMEREKERAKERELAQMHIEIERERRNRDIEIQKRRSLEAQLREVQSQLASVRRQPVPDREDTKSTNIESEIVAEDRRDRGILLPQVAPCPPPPFPPLPPLVKEEDPPPSPPSANFAEWLDGMVTRLRSERDEAVQQLQNVRHNLEDMIYFQQQLVESKIITEEYEQEILRLKSEHEASQQQCSDANEMLAATTQSLNNAVTRIENLEREMESRTRVLAETEKDLRESWSRMAEMEETLRDCEIERARMGHGEESGSIGMLAVQERLHATMSDLEHMEAILREKDKEIEFLTEKIQVLGNQSDKLQGLGVGDKEQLVLVEKYLALLQAKAEILQSKCEEAALVSPSAESNESLLAIAVSLLFFSVLQTNLRGLMTLNFLRDSVERLKQEERCRYLETELREALQERQRLGIAVREMEQERGLDEKEYLSVLCAINQQGTDALLLQRDVERMSEEASERVKAASDEAQRAMTHVASLESQIGLLTNQIKQQEMQFSAELSDSKTEVQVLTRKLDETLAAAEARLQRVRHLENELEIQKEIAKGHQQRDQSVSAPPDDRDSALVPKLQKQVDELRLCLQDAESRLSLDYNRKSRSSEQSAKILSVSNEELSALQDRVLLSECLLEVEVEHSGIIKSVAMDTATELLHLGTSVILHLETELALALSSMKQNAVLADSLKKRVLLAEDASAILQRQLRDAQAREAECVLRLENLRTGVTERESHVAAVDYQLDFHRHREEALQTQLSEAVKVRLVFARRLADHYSSRFSGTQKPKLLRKCFDAWGAAAVYMKAIRNSSRLSDVSSSRKGGRPENNSASFASDSESSTLDSSAKLFGAPLNAHDAARQSER